MSTNKKPSKKEQGPGSGRQERYIQPSVLLGLKATPSYGYEIIRRIQEFGFVEGDAPPGMIYRHLRQLEEDELVKSEWVTEGTGPAKRMYTLTAEGEDFLKLWIDHMQNQVNKISRFIEHYHKTTQDG